MGARYKLPCLKPGRAIRRTWPKRNRRSTTGPGVIAKRALGNTLKTWKPRRRRRGHLAQVQRLPTELTPCVSEASNERLDTARRLRRLYAHSAWSIRLDQ